jgi:hypothetical protein
MSLAFVVIPITEFEVLLNHLVFYAPPYRCMHLREARQRNSRRQLRYLHTLYATTLGEVEGMISGPDIFCHYRLRLVGSRTQVNLLAERGTPFELDRIARRYVIEVSRRIAAEQSDETHYPTRLPGQFYLRRRLPGMADSHANCLRAVAERVLDQQFVSQLAFWGLELLCP